MCRRIFIYLCCSFWLFPSQALCIEVTETSKLTTVDIRSGWNLLGATTTFSPEQLGCANTVWTYDSNGTWRMFGSNIMDENNYNHTKLSRLEPGVGYWVYSNTQGCTSAVGGWSAIPNITLVDNFFIDTLVDVNVSDIASKSFTILLSSYPEQPTQEYELNFNSYGTASIVVSNHYNASVVHTWSFKAENGLLHFFIDNVYEQSYKVLAKEGNIGIVFGKVSSPVFFTEEHGTLGHMFYILNQGVQEQAVNMATQIPFVAYRNHVEDLYEVFASDGNYTEYYNNEAQTIQPYAIREDGSLATTFTYFANSEEDYFDDAIFQVMYQIGRYKIMRVRFEGGAINKSTGEKSIRYSYEKMEINSPIPFLIRYEGV